MKKLEVVLTERDVTLLRLELPTDLSAAQLLEAMNLLVGREQLSSGPSSPMASTSKKYRALTERLNSTAQPQLVLSFQDIERLLGSSLPASAREHRAWWANSDSHSQARAWMAVGWQMDSVDMAGETVIFRKEA